MTNYPNLTGQQKIRHLTLQSTFLLLLLLGLNYVFSFAWQAYLTRVLGADIYGHVFFADKLLLCYAYLLDLGYFMVGASAWQEQEQDRQACFNAIFLLKIGTALIMLGSLIVLERLILSTNSPTYSYLVYPFFVAVLLEKLLPDYVYRAEHRMLYLLFGNLASRLSLLLMLLIFVRTGQDYVWIPIIYALAATLLLILTLADLWHRKKIKLSLVGFSKLKSVFQQSFSLAGAKLANCCFCTITVIALHYAKPDAKLLSYFLLLDLLFTTGRKVLNLLGESFYLHLHKNADAKWYKQLACSLALFMLLAIFGLYWQADIALQLLFGAEFVPATPYLRTFLLAALPACLSALLAYPLLATRGQLKWTNRAFAVGTGFYAVTLVYLYLTVNLTILQILYAYVWSVYLELVVNLLAVWVYNRRNGAIKGGQDV